MATRITAAKGGSAPATISGIFYTCPRTQKEAQAVTGDFYADTAGRLWVAHCDQCRQSHQLVEPR